MKGAKKYSTSCLGDKRLENRYRIVLRHLSAQMNASVPQANLEWKAIKGTYRLWDNEKVTPEGQLALHFQDIISSLPPNKERPLRVLQISDTVELNYTRHRCAKHLGPLKYIKHRGLHLHNSLLVSEQGQPLGVLKQTFHIRQDEKLGKSLERLHEPIQDKESARWLDHFDYGQTFSQTQGLEVVYVADREADILELFAQRSTPGMHFLIRSNHDRKLCDGQSNLGPTVDAWASQGTYQTPVFCSTSKKWRRANLEIRFGTLVVKLKNPLPHKQHLPPIALNVVDIREVSTNQDQEHTIHWRLLTSLDVQSFQDAVQICRYYVLRWIIERFHFILKSGGASVEKLQLALPHRLKNAITTYSIAAMDALQLRYYCDTDPDQTIDQVGIDDLSYKVLYTYVEKRLNLDLHYDPESPPTVKQFCITLGRIGGFLPSKRQPVPGVIILTRALERLKTLVDAYITFSQ